MQPNKNEAHQESKPFRRILSVRERESLKHTMGIYGYADMAKNGNYIPGSSGASPVEVPWLNVNRNRLNAQQKEVKRVLEEGTPEQVSGAEKDKLAKRAAYLQEKFTDPEFFQTREELRVMRRDNPAYFSALEKAGKWSKPSDKCEGRSPEDLANEWRSIQRTLEPESDLCDSLDRLRKPK